MLSNNIIRLGLLPLFFLPFPPRITYAMADNKLRQAKQSHSKFYEKITEFFFWFFFVFAKLHPIKYVFTAGSYFQFITKFATTKQQQQQPQRQLKSWLKLKLSQQIEAS